MSLRLDSVPTEFRVNVTKGGALAVVTHTHVRTVVVKIVAKLRSQMPNLAHLIRNLGGRSKSYTCTNLICGLSKSVRRSLIALY